MDLIRNDAVVALNEIIVAARTLTARLRLAADIGNDDDLTRQAAEIERIARQLGTIVRAEDPEEFPAAPSDEFLIMDAAAIRVRLTVAGALEELRREWYANLAEALHTHASAVPDAARPLTQNLQEICTDD
ncbi:MAG: hypothetical protein P1U65_03170 [Minwuia sp.]|nr:hypothetical protein [Minwuia sp.]